MDADLRNSVLHNLGVLAVGGVFALIGRGVDVLLGLPRITVGAALPIGIALALAGFLVRVWATVAFYRRGMDVISLAPQAALFTSGPYRYSRNPLYLGGNVFVFLGTSMIAQSLGGVLLTALNVVLLNAWMIPREERQLAARFGDEWTRYCAEVRRWL